MRVSSLFLSYSIILMSSANFRLCILWPRIRTSVSLSIITSNILYKHIMNVAADIGSPCLVPTVIPNHSPNSLSTLTVACVFSAILFISAIRFLITP